MKFGLLLCLALSGMVHCVPLTDHQAKSPHDEPSNDHLSVNVTITTDVPKPRDKRSQSCCGVENQKNCCGANSAAECCGANSHSSVETIKAKRESESELAESLQVHHHVSTTTAPHEDNKTHHDVIGTKHTPTQAPRPQRSAEDKSIKSCCGVHDHQNKREACCGLDHENKSCCGRAEADEFARTKRCNKTEDDNNKKATTPSPTPSS